MPLVRVTHDRVALAAELVDGFLVDADGADRRAYSAKEMAQAIGVSDADKAQLLTDAGMFAEFARRLRAAAARWGG